MAFIIVQHLDPSHDSMMVDLLAGHTSMPVLLATDGMKIERERVYVIPPGVYLSVDDKGALRLSKPQARHGARLPFDFLLNSLAREYGARTVCVVLSGTGADGSLGLKAVKEKGGLVIAQDIGEADYDGMPRSAIATGAVDFVLRAGKDRRGAGSRANEASALCPEARNRPRKSRCRTCCRTSSLSCARRRFTISRFTSTARSSGASSGGWRWRGSKPPVEYLDLLRSRRRTNAISSSKDLLINVTGFFRDPAVFDFLAKSVIPDLVRDHPLDRPLRIWVAGCSSGEETYSLAMLFREQIDASKREIKLQIFASDVDPDAVASAREGLYPDSIEADVSPKRLARFFSKEDRFYRISAELRSSVVFTVHDVLADPPFARLDFVSCRNLLIYLLPEAQAKVISIIHFALREGGLLLVGDAETVGVDRRSVRRHFESRSAFTAASAARDRAISALSSSAGDGSRLRARPEPGAAPSRQIELAELCRRMVLEAYGPAAVLINRKLECLYFQGPTDRYLKVASGRPGQ